MFEEVDALLLELLLPFKIPGKMSYDRIKKLYELYIDHLNNPKRRVSRREYHKYKDLFDLLYEMNECRMWSDQIKNHHSEWLRLNFGKDTDVL